MKSLNHYYGVQSLSLMQYGAWASARTLITFCVNSNEVGKIYASVGIIAAIIPLISNPVFRQIYNTVSITKMKNNNILHTVNSQIQPALEYNPLSNITLIKTQFFFSKNQ